MPHTFTGRSPSRRDRSAHRDLDPATRLVSPPGTDGGSRACAPIGTKPRSRPSPPSARSRTSTCRPGDSDSRSRSGCSRSFGCYRNAAHPDARSTGRASPCCGTSGTGTAGRAASRTTSKRCPPNEGEPRPARGTRRRSRIGAGPGGGTGSRVDPLVGHTGRTLAHAPGKVPAVGGC